MLAKKEFTYFLVLEIDVAILRCRPAGIQK
jgi:hypothetical protein